MTLDTIKTIVIPACHEFDVKQLDIFGSFARGVETPKSDIDFLIVSFRNILAHGYDSIDDLIVWSAIEEHLDNLVEDVNKLIKKVEV